MATILCGAAILTGCVNMDLTATNEPSASLVTVSPTMAAQVANGTYRGLQYRFQESDKLMWQPYSSVIDRDANWLDLNHMFARITSSDGKVLDAWSSNFEYAIKANNAIAVLQSVQGMDENQRLRLIAECKFLRCFWHYQLNVLFQGVPYIRQDIKDPDDANLPRLTMAQVWKEILIDLQEVIDCPSLPDKYAKGASDWGRITKSCAYALRGKVYMWQKEWKKAADDFQAVEKCGHKLFTEGEQPFKKLFKEENEDCDEMIFSVCFSPAATSYGNALHRAYAPRSVMGSDGWTNFIINPAYVDLFENADGSKFNWDDIIPGYNSMNTNARRVYFLRNNLTDPEYQASQVAGADMGKYLVNNNEARIRKAYENRDPRLNQSVVTPYDTFLGGVRGVAEDFTSRFPFRDEASGDLKTDISSMFYYLERKFVKEGLEGTSAYYSYIDVPLIRFAEVLLDWAECLNEQGDYLGAVKLVNKVRGRCGAALLNSNSHTTVNGVDDMRIRIQNEHYFELGGEESIYFDELRWGTWENRKFYRDSQGQMNGMRQVWGSPTYNYIYGGDQYYSWPIPEKEIQINPNMVQSPQWK